MAKITFEDKEDKRIVNVPEKNKIMAINLNEIKNSVNWLYDNQVDVSNRVLKTGDTMTGNLLFETGMGIDTTATGGTDTLNIGSTNADVINIGRAGATVNIFGSVTNYKATNAEITDSLITLNKGGGVGSAVGVGFEIEENNLITGYVKTNATRNGYDLLTPAIAYKATFLFSSLTADKVYTLPNTTGTLALLSDITGGTPGGANTNIQFNNAGTFGGDSNFVWDNTNKHLALGTTNNANTQFNILKTYSFATGGSSYGIRNTTNYNAEDFYAKYGFQQYTSLGTLTSNTAGLFGINSYMSYGNSSTDTPFANFLANGTTNTTGNSPNWTLFRGNNISGSGVITNLTGLYIENLTAATNNWAIYIDGTTKSYFGGKVGFGITTPSATIHSSKTDGLATYTPLVGGTRTFGNTIGEQTITTIPTDSSVNPYYYGTLVNFASDPGAKQLECFTSYAEATPNGVSYLSLNLVAGKFQARSNGNSTLYGMYGVRGSARNGNSGANTFAVGVDGAINNVSTGTIIDAHAGLFGITNTSTGIITNAYGIKIATIINSGGGTITNAYGLYIDSQLGGYGIYQSSASDKNYFAGNTGIGGAATTTSKLNITGLPTSAAGLATGDVWSNSGILTIV